jgi:sigma-B regulation protein RsbU (phosphoserine phosphatase)
LAAAVLVIVFMVFSIMLGLRQWLLAPIDILRRAVNSVAAGRYDTQIPGVGPKEIVALAANVEAMRAQLVHLVRQNERSWEALAQQGPAVVALRDALTPSTLHASGMELRGRVDPAEGELAGDWFDSFDLPNGKVGLVVGDVSGHGAAAGVFALRLKQLLGAALNSGAGPGLAIEWAVGSLGDTDEMFATAVVVVIDPSTGVLQFANAGHPEPLVLHRSVPGVIPRIPSQPPDGDGSRAPAGALASGRDSPAQGIPIRNNGGGHLAPGTSDAGSAAAVEMLRITGPLVASLLAAPGAWRTETVRLWPGDVLFAYTDGLVEARNAGGEQFGQARLVEAIMRDSGRQPVDLLDSAFDAVRRHAPGRPGDDRTAIVLARTSPLPPV